MLSEDEELFDDPIDDDEQKAETFYEAWKTCCEDIKNIKEHVYWKRKQVNLFIL